MGNAKTKSKGRRERQDHVTMRSLKREVKIYRAYNEKIMKAREEILQIQNMLQKQANKEYGTKQEASGRKVTSSRSHRINDVHGNSRKSRSMRKHHHSLQQSTRGDDVILRLGSIQSVFPMTRQRRRPE
jgi:hypothetical protein